MARITIEDCKKYVDNRFELVVLASYRAMDLFLGKPALLAAVNDKPAVVALREIAAGLINVEELKKEIIRKIRKNLHSSDYAKNSGGAEFNEEITDLFRHLLPEDDTVEGDLANLAALKLDSVVEDGAESGLVDEVEDEHEDGFAAPKRGEGVVENNRMAQSSTALYDDVVADD